MNTSVMRNNILASGTPICVFNFGTPIQNSKRKMSKIILNYENIYKGAQKGELIMAYYLKFFFRNFTLEK